MVLGLESIPFMKLTVSVHQRVGSEIQKSQKVAAVVSKIGEKLGHACTIFSALARR